MFYNFVICLIALAVACDPHPQQPVDPPVQSPATSQSQPKEAASQSGSTAKPQTDENKTGNQTEIAEPTSVQYVDTNQQSITIDKAWKRLGKNQIWINQESKQVMVRGSICLRKGPLEMFACPLQTKEHESIVAVEAKSSEIHACLVALGFQPGSPVQWQPTYKSAAGPSIKIQGRWMADGEQKTADAKSWVVKSGTKQTLETDWVFGGSEIFVDRVDGRKIYYADSGEMICLSNFPTAMMDVPIKSSDSADGLLFEANTDAIPPLQTQVYLIMTPRK